MNSRGRLAATIAASLTLAAGVAACGDDEEETSGGEEAASAEKVTVTTSDTADGYTWDLSATPTADTKSITFENDSEEEHALIFARINEGYTLEEAYELQGEKDSAEVLVEGGAKPGKTARFKVNGEVQPGDYAMLCPIGTPQGLHYKQGQLEEFEIQ